MMPARKEVGVPVNTFTHFEIEHSDVEVGVRHAEDPDRPVTVILRSTDGQEVVLRLSPNNANRLGQRIITQAEAALEGYRPSKSARSPVK